MLKKRQLKNILFILGMLGLMMHAAQAQVYSIGGSSSTNRSTNRDARDSRPPTNRDVDRGRNYNYQGSGGYLRYEDRNFGFQIGTPSYPCYNCGGYGYGYYYPPPPPPSYHRPYPPHGSGGYYGQQPPRRPAGKPRVLP